MSTFQVSFSNILDMAIALEQRGQAFYGRAASLATDPPVKRFFEALVQVEERHELQFRKLRSKFTKSGTLDTPHDPGGKRARLVQKFTEGQIFDGVDPAKLVAELSLEEIVLQAIRFEEETADYYAHLKPFLTNPAEAKWLDKVRHEEQTHARSLERILKEIRNRL